MRKERKNRISLLLNAIFSTALLLSSGFSFAWFYNEKKIDMDDGLTGSVLQKYFHDGDGSQENPFIITRPRHYENMVLLHYNLEGFAEKEFYYEFGTDINGDGEKEMYNYVDGKVDYSVNNGYSTTLNCDRIASLAPLGSKDLPFNSHIQGNNMTISGFKIDATRGRYSDIGIFGFVGYGTCLNAYFSNFEIDTTGTIYDEPTSSELANDTAHVHNQSAVHFGYIAGHLDETQNFQNVYVNNCTLKGTTNGLHVNNYGYYGRAEQDALGGGLGYGRDYKFSLNSQSIYNYFNTNYNDIKNKQLVKRNNRYAQDVEPNENGDRIKRVVDSSQNVVPFSTAVSPDSAAGSGTYVINDGYSLSTSGYASPEFREIRRNYNVYYQDRDYISEDGDNHSYDGTVKTPSSDVTYREDSLMGTNQGSITDPDTGEERPTKYYRFNEADNKYYYGESYNRDYDPDRDNTPFNLTIKIKPFTLVVKETLDTELTTSQVFPENTALYFDDDNENSSRKGFDVTLNNQINSVNENGGNTYISFNESVVTIPNALEGTHNISIVLKLKYQSNAYWLFGWRRTYHYNTFVFGIDYSAGKLSPKQVTINDRKNPYELQVDGEFVGIENDTTDKNYPAWNALMNNNCANIIRPAFTPPDANSGLIHIDDRSFETPFLYKIVENGVEQQDFSLIPELDKSHNSSFVFDETTQTWTIELIRREPVENPESKNYFPADETQIMESGYRSKNIDIVGGGAEFYYQTIVTRSIAVLSLTSESYAGQLCKSVPAKGSFFYADEQCKSSIVVYLKNTSNALDNRDDALGKISFTFVRPKVFGYTSSTVDPVFKKGNGFLSLTKAGTNIVESQDSNFISLTHNISLDLMESDVQKVSYCALDEEGKVLGSYNSNGTTTMTREEQVKIDTYILVLGGQSSENEDTWITNIDFEYKAQDGYGGTFGSIGYRDATDTIENTILNYYLCNPTVSGETVNFSYYVNVRFTTDVGEESTKSGIYYITCYSDTAVDLKIFNYYPGEYDVYVKSDPGGGFEQVSGSTPTVSIPASTIPTG